MRVKSFPEKLAKWECVDTQDPSLGNGWLKIFAFHNETNILK